MNLGLSPLFLALSRSLFSLDLFNLSSSSSSSSVNQFSPVLYGSRVPFTTLRPNLHCKFNFIHSLPTHIVDDQLRFAIDLSQFLHYDHLHLCFVSACLFSVSCTFVSNVMDFLALLPLESRIVWFACQHTTQFYQTYFFLCRCYCCQCKAFAWGSLSFSARTQWGEYRINRTTVGKTQTLLEKAVIIHKTHLTALVFVKIATGTLFV